MTNTLKDRLSVAMRDASVTAAELARACKIRPPSVSDWLSGETKSISGKNLLAASKRLGVTPEWLSTGQGPRDATDTGITDSSQTVRLDPDIIQGVARAMQDTAEELKVSLGIKETVELFSELYGRVGDSGITTADVVWLVRRLEQGASHDARRGNISNGPRDAKGEVGRGRATS
jgi:transcriptional regulator with XRE-family HTH domain